MRYISTRGETAPLSFKDAVITGLAPDGGLLLPEQVPDVAAELAGWRGLSFQQLAVEVMSCFIGDVSREDLTRIVQISYGGFDAPEVTPVVGLGDLTLLELFHGPTLAFKDVALQFLGNLFEHILTERRERLNVIGATSGDTGSAAIAGVRGKDRIAIFVMYPQGRTSALQELQMITVVDDNVHSLAIDGSFDDCQGILKRIFGDLEFKQRFHLGAVNSVNWARVLAQIVYYIYSYLLVAEEDEALTFSVPTGNFGDIFAGFMAARMGLPVDRLILATNENDILTNFFNTGRYRRGQVQFTITPAMDIQVASNFERFLYYRLGEDGEAVKSFMQSFTDKGEASVEVDGPVCDLIEAISIDTDATLAEMREVYERHRYVLDPHTAVGVAAARRLPRQSRIICLATAHPAKFPESVERALGGVSATHPSLQGLDRAPTRREVLPADEEAVKRYVSEHAL
ncbi:MAG: threonine synthase [Gammaproteobacteria bacterium]|nr:threonine synthase [Gammaproteobacteria bacterium]